MNITQYKQQVTVLQMHFFTVMLHRTTPYLEKNQRPKSYMWRVNIDQTGEAYWSQRCRQKNNIKGVERREEEREKEGTVP